MDAACNRLRAAAFARPVLFLACVWVLSGAQTATAARPSPESVLRRLLAAMRGVNMRGTEVTMLTPPNVPGATVTRRVVRTRGGASLTKCVAPADQKGFVAYDDGHWTKSYDPTSGDVKVTRSCCRTASQKALDRLVRLIKRNYKLTVQDREVIAGRSCYVLVFKPVHSYSHEQKLWVDTQTGAVLSHVENNARGHTISVSFFTSVEFPSAIPAGDLKSPFPPGAPTFNLSRSLILQDIGKAERLAGFDVCVPVAMPAGYEFQHCEVVSFNGNAATCLRYTDGLADITVYQSAPSEGRQASIPSCRVSQHPMGNTVVEYRNGPMSFMVVGRTEQAGLLDVVRSLNTDRERTVLGYFGKQYSSPAAELTTMRNRGMGTDVMDALLAIRQQTRQPLTKLLALHDEGYSWDAIAQQYKANVKLIRNHIRPFRCR